MTVPLILLAFLSVTVGFIAFNWTDSYLGFVGFLEPGEKFHFTIWLTVLSAVLASLGVLIGWLVYVKGVISPVHIANRFPTIYRILLNQYLIDEIYQWVIDKVVLFFAQCVAVFDRVVINDTGVDGFGLTVKLSAFRLRYLQSGWLYTYGIFMALGVVASTLIWWVVFT